MNDEDYVTRENSTPMSINMEKLMIISKVTLKRITYTSMMSLEKYWMRTTR